MHAASTCAMAGVIWFVQLVHYPAFEFVDPGRFAAFSEYHQRRTTWVVAPLMLVEAASASLLLFLPLDAAFAARLGWALLVAIWLSTAFVQVPLHRRLGEGWDPATIRRLVRSNALRTALWSARAALAAFLLT